MKGLCFRLREKLRMCWKKTCVVRVKPGTGEKRLKPKEDRRARRRNTKEVCVKKCVVS